MTFVTRINTKIGTIDDDDYIAAAGECTPIRQIPLKRRWLKKAIFLGAPITAANRAWPAASSLELSRECPNLP